MTVNISYLSNFKEINRGYVAFGGNPKGGKITGKDTECVVLSSDFKLLDENHVLLRVLRENNMYNVDLKNIVPLGDLTCLFAKATLDESNLWHRRLSHINFKTMNKLVKGIKSEFSVARTPQQNRVAKRKNRNLIEAARTMLADSLLPIPFWAKAVNTARYVQNRVLVTKPHNKTPYELLLGRTSSIEFMRPFGCLVTILNTLDPLGKFDGKADEGFLVGYSVSSKAFRVFNSNTRIVQETLHINFLENQPNVAGSGPTWLFVIDTLTQSMNYQPVVAGNQPKTSAGIQENLDAGKVGKETISTQQYVLLPLWSAGSKDPQNTDGDAAFADKENESEVHVSTTRVNAASAPVTAVGLNSINITNSFNAAGPSDNAVSLNFEIGRKSSFMDPSQYLDDPDMPALEDIIYSDDKEDVGAEADFSNLETSITVSPIPTTRVHKDHPVTQIIGNLSLAPQTRSMIRVVKDQENGFQRGKIDHTLFIKKQKGDILLVQVYVDDIIFGSTNKELCKAFEKLMKNKFQMSSMGELTFLGLQVNQKDNGIFISQDKYVAKILRKFGLTDGKSASTPIDTKKPLPKDPDGEDVDIHIYRYLKGKPHLGLWYPKDSPFNLVAYFNSDYAGASLDRKSTTGGCQFLGYRLISWQCKKQTVVATSSTKAEYKLLCSSTMDSKSVAGQWYVDDLSAHNTKYTSPTLTQKVFASIRRIGKGLSRVDTPLFDGMLVQQQVQDVEDAAEDEDDDNEVSVEPTSLLPTPATSPPSPTQEHIPSPPQAQTAQPSSPPPPPQQTTGILMTLLNTLLETYATLTKQVANLEQDKIAQAIEITGNEYNKRDKIQAKPDKTEHKTESVEKSKVKSQQKVKPNKVKAKKIKKLKEIKWRD
nr:putative ribonuclease H-like domain-containing protein [Tanacetum cinerariifolium]